MDFGFKPRSKISLRENTATRKFLENECTSEFVRARMAEPAGVTDAFWAKLAEQGWTGLVYPEEFGGTGLGFVDLTVLMEEMGRAVMPGPFFSTSPGRPDDPRGGLGGAEEGVADQDRRRRGQGRAGLHRAERALGRRGAVAVTAREAGGKFTLSGTKLFVLDAHLADVIVVVARTRESKRPEEGLSLFLVPKGTRGLTVKLLPTMDQTRKLCEVKLDDVVRRRRRRCWAPRDGAWSPLARVLDRATVALCAEMCGGAQRVLDMTTEYAKIRIAFGKPIGSYQGVKHRAADMLVESENAKSLTYYAAWAVDENVPEAPLAASMAKAYASDAFRKIAGAGIQLHGGIGFTWEHDLHLYFKRAKSSEFTFGDATLSPRARRAADQPVALRRPLEGHGNVPLELRRSQTVIVASLMCSPVAQAFIRAEAAFPPLTWVAAFTPRSRTRRLAPWAFFVADLAMVSSPCSEVVADHRASTSVGKSHSMTGLPPSARNS